MASALALLSQAANGNTFEELKNGLHLKGNKTNVANQYLGYNVQLQKSAGNAIMSMANQLYVHKNYTLNKFFQKVVVQKFMSGIESVDFSKPNKAAEIINHFVEEKTNNKITNLIDPDSFDTDSRIVLVNAIYLKAKWHYEFAKRDTNKEEFYTNESEKDSIEFMHLTEEFNYGILPELNASALELPYFDSELSFLVVLPNSRSGLPALEAKLRHYDLTQIKDKMHKQWVNVTIPKFKVESEIKLNDVLKNVCTAHSIS